MVPLRVHIGKMENSVLSEIFKDKVNIDGNLIKIQSESVSENQQQINDALTKQWSELASSVDKESLYQLQGERATAGGLLGDIR